MKTTVVMVKAAPRYKVNATGPTNGMKKTNPNENPTNMKNRSTKKPKKNPALTGEKLNERATRATERSSSNFE